MHCMGRLDEQRDSGWLTQGDGGKANKPSPAEAVQDKPCKAGFKAATQCPEGFEPYEPDPSALCGHELHV